MDQLLPYPNKSISVPLPKEKEASSSRRRGISLPRLPHIALPNFMERRSRLDPVVFLTVTLSLCAACVLGTLYGPSYQVAVDGVEMGLVDNYQDVEAAIERVEERASGILGYDYTLHQEVDYTFAVSLKEDRVPLSRIESYLFNQVGEVMKTSVLTVKGQMLGATDDAVALDEMLLSLKAPYITENTVSAEFVEPVTVTREYTATSAIKDIVSMERVLTANTEEQATYTVLAGDTFSGIAQSLEMTMDDLLELNPQVTDIQKLMPGDILTIRRAVPFLSVRTVDHVVYDDILPYETERVDDDTIYEGYTKVRVAGVNGFATFTADVTCLNGEEESREILNTEVHEEPVTEVIAVGTKPRPKTMASGRLIWPLRGTITSSYGYRYIFGSYSYHSGLDISGSYGASIKAADGGKVTFAGTGTGSYWSYGNYVVIDHENGLQTIYAHCSSLYVKTGERVYQGQVIAAVGSTGRATGNHLHFQVKLWGDTVSPYNYLS